MQGPIAQVLSLAIYGNALLRNATRTAFFPGHSSCKFCKFITFALLEPEGGTHREIPFASTPDQWLARQATRNAVGFRVTRESLADPTLPDRVSVGFVGGGGLWHLQTIFGNCSELWDARWAVGDQNDPEQRVWQVTYGRVAWDQPLLPANGDGLSTHRDELELLLPEIAAFARAHDLGNFAECFDGALTCLHSDTPLASVFHNDLAPAGFLALQAEQLLAAAQKAWVFGGMGSWNDVGFHGSDQEQYERLSDRLYQLLNEAAIDAANSSFAASVP